MAEKFHINPETGNPNKCVAKPGNCRFGSDTNHYDSKDAARADYEQTMSGESVVKKTRAELAEEERVKACREHDEAYYAHMELQHRAQSVAIGHLRQLANASGLRITERTRPNNVFDAADAAIERLGTHSRAESIKELMEQTHDDFAKVNELRTEAAKMEQKYTGWSRFYLVPGGHIHKSMNCHTCNKSFMNPTSFQWMPGLSGKSDEEAVSEQGAYLCTMCYPDAPVKWTNGHDVEAEAKKNAQCPGSGTWDYDREKARLGYFSGNYATCTHCNERITVTKTNKLRGHPPK